MTSNQPGLRRNAARAQARRNATRDFSADVICPRCEAPVGEPCHVVGNPRLSLEMPHTDRTNAAAHERTVISLKTTCPVCGARPGVACANRDTPHPLRWGKSKRTQR